jgi:hypothetical protein
VPWIMHNKTVSLRILIHFKNAFAVTFKIHYVIVHNTHTSTVCRGTQLFIWKLSFLMCLARCS